MLWALGDGGAPGMITLDYPYFEGPPIPFSESTTYVEHEGVLAAPDTLQFNHGLGEIFTALTRAGMSVTSLEEHESVPWRAFDDDLMEEIEGGEWRLRERPERLAASYTLQAVRH